MNYPALQTKLITPEVLQADRRPAGLLMLQGNAGPNYHISMIDPPCESARQDVATHRMR
jgi:hypothetical protein